MVDESRIVKARLHRCTVIEVVAAVLVVAGLVVLGLWATPPRWLVEPRRMTLRGWGWARAHLLTAEVMGLLVGIAGFVIALRQQRVWSGRDTADERRRVRDRQVMLKRVRNRWITGVLDQSLAEEVRIRLGLARRPGVIAPPGRLHRRAGQVGELLAVDTSISDVFDELGGGLLILGAPGSGKTTGLLELARDLLNGAEADETLPMPVVFNLSSWAARRLPLAAWVIEELRTSYEVPQSIATHWVAAGDILPLLDGLDEVATARRSECVEAINAFHQAHGLVRFAVCCRTKEYTAAARLLQVEEAVELQPPTRQQVFDYLAAAGDALIDVQAALEADQTLWEFLQSPLVLNIVALTYQNRPAEVLRAAGTPSQRLTLLFTAYTQRMFEHRPGRYGSTQMTHWLVWLSQSMQQRSQSEFHLDRLQPDWLPTTILQRLAALSPAMSAGMVFGLATGLLFGSVGGLVGGLFFGLIVELFIKLSSREAGWDWLRLGGALVAGLAAGLVYGQFVGPTGGLVSGLGYGLFFGLFAGRSRTQPVEEVRWSWATARVGLPGALAAGLAVGLVAGLDPAVKVGGLVYSLKVGGLVYGLALMLFFGLIVGLVPALVHERSTPNEGIHRSARHALAIGLAAGLVGGLVGGMVIGPVPGLLNAVTFALTAGLMFGGLACLQHLAIRVMLAYNGFAPLGYVSFLDEATDRLFLRRAGSGYLFVHRLLLEYFADLDTARSPTEAEPPVTLRSNPPS